MQAAGLAAPLQRHIGTDGTLDIHVSRDLKVTEIIGPVALLEAPAAEVHSQVLGRRLSPRACRLSAIVRGQAAAVAWEALRDLQGDAVHIQVRWGHVWGRKREWSHGASGMQCCTLPEPEAVPTECKRARQGAATGREAVLQGNATLRGGRGMAGVPLMLWW